jgi:hypothetical protein
MAAQIYVNLFIYAYLRYYYNGHIDITTGIIILILIGVCINVYMYIYIYMSFRIVIETCPWKSQAIHTYCG